MIETIAKGWRPFYYRKGDENVEKLPSVIAKQVSYIIPCQAICNDYRRTSTKEGKEEKKSPPVNQRDTNAKEQEELMVLAAFGEIGRTNRNMVHVRVDKCRLKEARTTLSFCIARWIALSRPFRRLNHKASCEKAKVHIYRN